MNLVGRVVAGVFGLILLYLILFHGRAATQIIQAMGRVSIDGIKVLQGRG